MSARSRAGAVREASGGALESESSEVCGEARPGYLRSVVRPRRAVLPPDHVLTPRPAPYHSVSAQSQEPVVESEQRQLDLVRAADLPSLREALLEEQLAERPRARGWLVPAMLLAAVIVGLLLSARPLSI